MPKAGGKRRRRRATGSYAVVLDPLGHALNLEAGVSVGTIFGIYRAEDMDMDVAPSSYVLRAGSELIAAGYALYGASTQLVLSCGHGVDGFTLNPDSGVFMLTLPQLQMPPVGRFYSVNLGHRRQWSRAVADHIDAMSSTKSLRYIGTFIADVHRTLLCGGAFFYPPRTKRPNGKLRLLYEVAPIAFLMEQAGGACTSGVERLLDIVPTSGNVCVPVAFGSSIDITDYQRALSLRAE